MRYDGSPAFLRCAVACGVLEVSSLLAGPFFLSLFLFLSLILFVCCRAVRQELKRKEVKRLALLVDRAR